MGAVIYTDPSTGQPTISGGDTANVFIPQQLPSEAFNDPFQTISPGPFPNFADNVPPDAGIPTITDNGPINLFNLNPSLAPDPNFLNYSNPTVTAQDATPLNNPNVQNDPYRNAYGGINVPATMATPGVWDPTGIIQNRHTGKINWFPIAMAGLGVIALYFATKGHHSHHSGGE